jgi:hypothetical protein
MRFGRSVVVTLIFAGACAWAAAQGTQGTQVESVFRRLIPNPTGRNGYEEILLGADLCAASEVANAVQQNLSGATLTDKRRVLDAPKVRRGLELVRVGLGKPRLPLHARVDNETTFPELARFRNLARILMIEQYVLLADGKVSEAIESFRDTLRLGAASRGDVIIGGLVQVAIDAIGVRLLGDHLGQLSARDCDRLLSLAREWLAEPDPTLAMMAGERRYILNSWEKTRGSPDGILDLLAPSEDSEGDPDAARKAVFRTQFEGAMRNPARYASLVDALKARTSERIDSQMAVLRRPPWERTPIPDLPRDTLVDYLVDALTPTFDRFADRFVEEQATARLLGLHAAIRRYLWEHDYLPERLEDLHARDLILDPFTGKAMVYKRTGARTYELSSAGPHARDSDGRPTSARTPITLPRTQR